MTRRVELVDEDIGSKWNKKDLSEQVSAVVERLKLPWSKLDIVTRDWIAKFNWKQCQAADNFNFAPLVEI